MSASLVVQPGTILMLVHGGVLKQLLKICQEMKVNYQELDLNGMKVTPLLGAKVGGKVFLL